MQINIPETINKPRLISMIKKSSRSIKCMCLFFIGRIELIVSANNYLGK